MLDSAREIKTDKEGHRQTSNTHTHDGITAAGPVGGRPGPAHLDIDDDNDTDMLRAHTHPRSEASAPAPPAPSAHPGAGRKVRLVDGAGAGEAHTVQPADGRHTRAYDGPRGGAGPQGAVDAAAVGGAGHQEGRVGDVQ